MTDYKMAAVAAIAVATGGARSPDYGPASLALAEHRAAVADAAERTARDADAPIHTARAIMLLFDVLVGITIGTLRHDQEIWTLEVRRPIHGYACGTYRCLAGWLAHIAFPGLTPVDAWSPAYPGETRPDTAADEYYAAIYQGTRATYGQWARAALGATGEDQYPVAVLFSASATLAELWARAGELTDAAITIPANLAPTVAATRDHANDPRWVKA